MRPPVHETIGHHTDEQAPDPPVTSPEYLKQAGPWRRLAALLVDTCVFALVLGVLTMVFSVDFFAGPGLVVSAAGFWMLVSVLQVYAGTTAGKALFGIGVRATTGDKLQVGPALLRNLWMLFGMIPVVGAFVEFALAVVLFFTMITGSTRRGLHDRFAESVVLKV